MAKTRTNMITKGYHGKVGDQFVLRRRGNKSVLGALPDMENVKSTTAQVDQRKRFTGAVAYAKNALQDPNLKQVYETRATKEKTAFNIAVADFLTKPWIDQIDATAYNGNTGDKILVIAADNAKIDTVRISINDSNGTMLESGQCVYDAISTNWTYTATTAQTPVTGHKIVAAARDLPGHVTEKELVL